MATWYLGSNKHAAIAQWAPALGYSIGDIVRQLAAPSVNSERAFRVEVAGTSGGSEPSWNLTKNSTTSDNGITWREVTGNSTYAWTAAAARQRLFMDGASSWAADGDTVYRHESHAETQASGITWTSPGSLFKVLTVNDGVTALSTGATATTTGSNNLIFAGGYYDYGGTFIAGSGGTIGANIVIQDSRLVQIEEGKLQLSDTGISNITIGADTGGFQRTLQLINSDVQFAAATHGFSIRGRLIWNGGSLLTTVVTNLIKSESTGPGCYALIQGVDLSILNSGENLIAIGQQQNGEVTFERCEIDPAVSYSSGTHPSYSSVTLRVVNNGVYHKEDYYGEIDNEETVILAGVSSRKLTSSTNSNITPVNPQVLDDIILYNSEIGSPLTATVEVVNDGTTFTNEELWLEVEYLGDASEPIAFFANDFNTDFQFGTPANQTSSSASWTTTGLGSPIKQKLEVTFTPEMEGPIKFRVKLSKPSEVIYVHPVPTIA